MELKELEAYLTETIRTGEVFFVHEGDTESPLVPFVRNHDSARIQRAGEGLDGNWILIDLGRGFVVRCSMDDLLEEAERTGKEAVGELLLEAVQRAEESKKFINPNNFGDYQQVRKLLWPKLVNYDPNRQALSEAVYKRYGDIAVVVYLELGKIESSSYSTRLLKSMAVHMEKEPEELYEEALQRAAALNPPIVYTSARQLLEQTGTGQPLSAIKKRLRKEFVLTADLHPDAAAALFYPGVKEELYRITGEEYYAAFTSSEEVMIHPVSKADPEVILYALKKTNREFPEAFFSYSVFKYNAAKKDFDVVPVSAPLA